MAGRLKNHVRQVRRGMTDLTQAQLAEKAGCTRQTILALEQEKYNPSLILAIKIAKALDVPLDQLFELEEDQDR
jgi:putative transcriptional regulator